MLFNVSTLLSEPLGSTRSYTLDHEPVAVPAEGYSSTASGVVQMLRTERGILVHARLTVHPRLLCGRCLAPLRGELALEFDEEFLSLPDPLSGAPVPDADPDDFRIDARQHLDLSEAVRQYEQPTLPIRPLCRPDCAGLCPTCGQDLNERACACRPDETDARWAGLVALAERMRTEERDAGPKA